MCHTQILFIFIHVTLRSYIFLYFICVDGSLDLNTECNIYSYSIFCKSLCPFLYVEIFLNSNSIIQHILYSFKLYVTHNLACHTISCAYVWTCIYVNSSSECGSDWELILWNQTNLVHIPVLSLTGLWFLGNDVTLQNLCFHLSKMVPTSMVVMRMELHNAYKLLNIVPGL